MPAADGALVNPTTPARSLKARAEWDPTPATGDQVVNPAEGAILATWGAAANIACARQRIRPFAPIQELLIHLLLRVPSPGLTSSILPAGGFALGNPNVGPWEFVWPMANDAITRRGGVGDFGRSVNFPFDRTGTFAYNDCRYATDMQSVPVLMDVTKAYIAASAAAERDAVSLYMVLINQSTGTAGQYADVVFEGVMTGVCTPSTLFLENE